MVKRHRYGNRAVVVTADKLTSRCIPTPHDVLEATTPCQIRYQPFWTGLIHAQIPSNSHVRIMQSVTLELNPVRGFRLYVGTQAKQRSTHDWMTTRQANRAWP